MTKKEVIIAPSLLSCDFSRLSEELLALEEAGVKWVHWDVMDGNFVPNITLGPCIIEACRKKSKLFFDVHLMIERPERYIKMFADAGADLICVHAESTVHLESVISAISDLNVKPAIALNPHTPICQIEYLIPQLYMVLIMSVNPGFGGQKFIPFSLKKIKDLAEFINNRGLDTLIEVDGGVNIENVKEIVKCGANVIVSGSAFFKHPPYKKRLQEFLKAIL